MGPLRSVTLSTLSYDPALDRGPGPSSGGPLTSRHLLHEDLDEAVLADGAQVLHDVPVLQTPVERDLLVERLGVPEVETGSRTRVRD